MSSMVRSVGDFTRRNPVIIVLVTVVLCVATVTILAFAYKHQQHLNDHRFCTLMNVLLAPGQKTTNPRAEQIKEALIVLARQLGCARG